MKAGFHEFARAYSARLTEAMNQLPLAAVEKLATALMVCWREKRQVFVFGNGGSAGNAIHLANDFIYGISKQLGHALRIHALTANPSVITCLANDEGYDGIFFRQLAVLAEPGDIAIAFSGSGNSPNICKALEWCKQNSVSTYAVLGYQGGKAKALADVPIHIEINDMQVSEDLQLIIGHMLMQWLYEHHTSVARSHKNESTAKIN